MSLNRDGADGSDEGQMARDGADGSDEGQMACGTDVAIPGRPQSSHKNEDLSDDELGEYDLENYDEEECTGKKKLNVRYAV